MGKWGLFYFDIINYKKKTMKYTTHLSESMDEFSDKYKYSYDINRNCNDTAADNAVNIKDLSLVGYQT